ncbi:permease-like cell division protein FtsX [Wenzhouxiangella marina]|uniref:Cell division protein FtsX n=1 Tax=Wenzhouxiangella marina TaxID=1579979 RepID=A0A0K0XXC7_9GAMM|nr:permease-like cell division protein FtsX [Wenzhouxiangella marina]AKS42266.1 cell division protein FtsX [Wenzhouxiangella marina]MBB6085961.1 cell division transport system permease protein [Wenzhouxiangella marina]
MARSRHGGMEALPGAAGVRAWARRHAFSFLSSLGALTRQPIASAMTLVVLAVALTLPTALHVTLDNVSRISQNWERLDTLSVFLDQDVDENAARSLGSRITLWDEVAAVDPISPEIGLAEVTGQLQIENLADSLPDNPLPWVLEITPETGTPIPTLVNRLEREAGVDTVVVDLKWLERLDAMLDVISQLVILLAALFAVGVAFIIANTIRMDIQNRREEIEVMALVGATPAFIRRPFLYTGLWYGLIGGTLAWLIVRFGLIALAGPIADLSGSYDANFSLQPPALEIIALLILGAGLFGILGAWLVVNQHLKRINP